MKQLLSGFFIKIILMQFTEKDVLEALSYVDDPDLKKDLVSLGMISEVEVSDNKVVFKVTLTTPACPLKEQIKRDCINAVHQHLTENLEVEVKMDAVITTNRADEQFLKGVKNVIAVASGKGGVGKSTVAVNLALGLAKQGAKVGLIDADIYGPSIPVMLGLEGQKPEVEKQGEKYFMHPIEKYGVKWLSIGLMIDPSQAVVWRGPMVTSALRQFVSDVIWGELDYLIFDLPPGTGDVHLTIAQTMPITAAVVVTTPQEVALADVKKSLGMFLLPQINVPILGIIENMSYFTPPELPEKKYYLFGKGGGQKLADEYNLPLLSQIPIQEQVQAGGDSGKPAILGENQQIVGAFDDLAVMVARFVAIKNAEGS